MIAFTRASDPADSSQNSRFPLAVFVVNEDGTEERMLAEGASAISWLGNGEEILVTSESLTVGYTLWSDREFWTVNASSGARSEPIDRLESLLSGLPCQNRLHEIIGLRLRGR